MIIVMSIRSLDMNADLLRHTVHIHCCKLCAKTCAFSGASHK